MLSKLKELEKIPLFSLHGKMVHKKRTIVYKDYTEKSNGVLFCTDLAARGLDIPDIDWVIQFDAPQDPAAFVHRVGRTARLGKFGKALVMLQPNEEAYIDFLTIRKVPLIESTFAPTFTDTLSKIKAEIKTDRALYEKVFLM